MYRRSTRIFEILGRKKPSDVSVASHADFQTRLVKVVDALPVAEAGLPYSIDFGNERMISVITNDDRNAVTYPFLYQYQYKNARTMISIPFEGLEQYEYSGLIRPTFVFSIGRCGSTLLSSLMTAFGHCSISEPDIFTVLARLTAEEQQLIGPQGLQMLVRRATEAFVRQGDGEVSIKLRSHCNTIAGRMVKAVPESRTIFILRDRISWAKSRYRVFGEDPRTLAKMYRNGIQTYDQLFRLGSRPKLVWYEELAQDPISVLKKLGVAPMLEEERISAMVDEVLTKDAQEGTAVARNRYNERRLSEEMLRDFESEWSAIVPHQLIERHGISLPY